MLAVPNTTSTETSLDESFSLDRTAFFDRAQDRLILLGGHRAARKTWALSLQTRDWTLLDARNSKTSGHGSVAVLDESSKNAKRARA